MITRAMIMQPLVTKTMTTATMKGMIMRTRATVTKSLRQDILMDQLGKIPINHSHLYMTKSFSGMEI